MGVFHGTASEFGSVYLVFGKICHFTETLLSPTAAQERDPPLHQRRGSRSPVTANNLQPSPTFPVTFHLPLPTPETPPPFQPDEITHPLSSSSSLPPLPSPGLRRVAPQHSIHLQRRSRPPHHRSLPRIHQQNAQPRSHRQGGSHL